VQNTCTGKEKTLDPKKYFQKYHSRICFEAFLRSLLLGLVIGLGSAFAAAFVTWFLSFNGLWLTLAVLVAVTAGFTALFYFKVYQPTAMSNARRLDRYGLEERLITMVEYDGDDSYIAEAQRNDAKAELAKFEAKQIKFKFSTKILVSCIISAVIGLGMTLITTLSSYGIVPTGNDVLNVLFPPPPDVYYEVKYVVAEEGTGYILGESSQSVIKGGNSEAVVAVAADGFIFKGWDDGNKSAERQEGEVLTALEFSAIFIHVDDDNADESEDEEEADDLPEDSGGEGPGEGEGEGSGDGAAGKYEDYNQIINGSEYYRDHLSDAQDNIDNSLQEDGDGLTDEQKEVIKNYIGIV